MAMKAPFTIIDGYNVLHGCGMIRGVGPGALRRARNLLLGILQRHATEAERQRMTLVFDSSLTFSDSEGSSPELPVEVLYATATSDADELIEELIQRHSSPKQLVVVSSDHRLQRAAAKRGARFMDSPEWFDQMINRDVGPRPISADSADARQRNQQLEPDQVQQWLEEWEFPLEGQSSNDADERPLSNPFPPGYVDRAWEDDGD